LDFFFFCKNIFVFAQITWKWTSFQWRIQIQIWNRNRRFWKRMKKNPSWAEPSDKRPTSFSQKFSASSITTVTGENQHL
jgi:hypothetical protein